MLEIYLGEVLTFVVTLGAVCGIVAAVVSWVNKKLKRIDKLEHFILDENGMPKIVIKYVYEDTSRKLMDKLDELRDAVNIINASQMIQLEVHIDNMATNDSSRQKLLEAKKMLDRKRGIV